MEKNTFRYSNVNKYSVLRFINITSDSDKANIFTENLADVFKPHYIIPDITHTLNITRFLECSLPMALPAKHTSPGEIQYIIHVLPNLTKKVPGHDLISNLIVKQIYHTTNTNFQLHVSFILLSYSLETFKHNPNSKTGPTA